VEHVAIRDAIAAHRPAAARAAMHEHLERSHRRFSRDFGEAPFVHEDNEGKPASTAAALQPGKGANPSKTRKEPHKAAAC
jgi:hypothetical protein